MVVCSGGVQWWCGDREFELVVVVVMAGVC